MSNTNDERIQRILEEMHHIDDDLFSDKDSQFLEDARMYQLLFKELKELPVNDLPPDFATKITRRIAASEQPVNAGREEFVIIVSFTVAGILLAIGLMVSVGFSIQQIPRSVLYIFAFAIISFLIVQVLENSLMKRKTVLL